MPAGRPSDYNTDMASRICEEIASGRSLRMICVSDEFPADRTVYRWLEAHEEFRQQYARARELQAETLADEILDISNTPVIGAKTKTGKDGVEVTEGDMIEHRRLQVDARKWLAGKLAPKKYGDKVDHSHTVNPINVNIALDCD